MKKHFIVLIGLFALVFASCDLIEDATTIDIDTELKTTIPVVSAEDVDAFVIKSAQLTSSTFSFSGTKTFSLADNKDLEEYIDNVKGLEAKNVAVITFPSEVEGIISSCTLSYGVGTADNTITVAEVKADASGNMVINLSTQESEAMLSFIEKNIKNTITYQLAGTANYNVNGSVKVVQDVTVEANVLD